MFKFGNRTSGSGFQDEWANVFVSFLLSFNKMIGEKVLNLFTADE